MKLVFLADLTGVDLTEGDRCFDGVGYYLFVMDLVGVFFEADRFLVGVLLDIIIGKISKRINNLVI